jgi:hypothetical protein
MNSSNKDLELEKNGGWRQHYTYDDMSNLVQALPQSTEMIDKDPLMTTHHVVNDHTCGHWFTIVI